MKKLLVTAIVFSSIGIFASSVQAQDTSEVKKDTATLGQKIKKTAKKTGKAIGKGAKTVGDKTAELASKGSSEVIDKTYDGKMGPDGQKIFINDKSEYYWVDEKGHRHYVKENELKDKKD